MTDSEIIKALECCSTYGTSCKTCPAFVKVDHSKCREVLTGAIDLIHRKQAEIETLTARIGIYETCNARKDEAIHNLESEIARLQNILLRFMDEVAKWEEKHGLDVSELPLIPICDERRSIINHHRAEAIKEFAERYKASLEAELAWCECVDEITKPLDNLVKEMVGDV